MNYIKNYYTLKAIFIKKILLNIIMSNGTLPNNHNFFDHQHKPTESQKNYRESIEKKYQKYKDKYYSNEFFDENMKNTSLEDYLKNYNDKEYLTAEQKLIYKGLNGLYRLTAKINDENSNLIKGKTNFCTIIPQSKFNTSNKLRDHYTNYVNAMKKVQKFICKGFLFRSGKDCIILSNRSIEKIKTIKGILIPGQFLDTINTCFDHYKWFLGTTKINNLLRNKSIDTYGGKKNNNLNNKVKIEKLKLKNKKEVEKMKNKQKKEIISLKNKQKKELNKLKNM